MFKSFFLAGFECATGYNLHREWIDQIEATQHERYAQQDYAMIRSVGIHAARESVRWPLVDLGHGHYDFSTVEPLVDAACRNNVDVVWDIFHYGHPTDIDLYSDEFPKRFADYCYAVASYLAKKCPGQQLYFTPCNEPSYFAYAGGEAGLFAPHVQGRGYDLKVALIRATIQGIDAIWAALPNARMVNVDALCRVHAPIDAGPDDPIHQDVNFFNDDAVFQSWDWLAGRRMPELGGSPKHLDIVGINYYWTNQWQIGQEATPLKRADPRTWSLGQMARWAYERTGHPVLITETGHIGDNRAWWMDEIAVECEQLLEEGIPLLGACLYPILGMPEWHRQNDWVRMGLWDLLACKATGVDQGKLMRVPNNAAMAAFSKARRLENLPRLMSVPAGPHYGDLSRLDAARESGHFNLRLPELAGAGR